MFESAIRSVMKLFGSHNERVVRDYRLRVDSINALEDQWKTLSDDELAAKTPELRGRLEAGESLNDILPEAFATVREASSRTVLPGETVGLRHFDVQLMGGIALHTGGIAEMATGEGKTLVATAPAYLNALSGDGVHVITVNDYLASRDCEWMRPIYERLGLTVGAIQGEMGNSERRAIYAHDITYGTNNEFGFDYLRDNMKASEDQQVQRSRNFAILDEVDNILIDEARTPLIISGPGEGDTQKYFRADQVLRKLRKDEHYEVKEKESQCIFTEEGIIRAQEIVGCESFYTGKFMEWPHLLEQAMRAHNLFEKDVDYMIDRGEDGGQEVVIIDEFTGRAMPGRRWSDGLHQAVEAKERIQIKSESQTMATITFQNFFKLYSKLGGMTGTALTEAGEFLSIYGLNTTSIPTNEPNVRDDMDDQIYADQKDKYRAIVEEVIDIHGTGRPILIGTTSIERSELLSGMLERRGINHEVLNAKQHAREADIVSNAGQEGAVTIATNMAGRGTDIKLGNGLVERGGLHVLGTERHEARRIDNQLRGRCARQGDNGSSRFFLALDDDLMRRFASGNIASMLKKLGLKDGQKIEHKWINRSIANAQKKVEQRNFEIRKNLLEYDNVMNEQRTLIYARRNQILAGEALRGLIDDMLVATTERAVEQYLDNDTSFVEWAWDDLEGWYHRKVDETIQLNRSEKDTVVIEDTIISAFKDVYDQRAAKAGEEEQAHVESYLLLNAFDTRWKEHLANMDALKAGIGLRGYAQVDPKVEYKREAYLLFDQLIAAIQDEVTDFIFRVQISTEETAASGVWDNQSADHQQLDQYEAGRTQNEAAIARNQTGGPAKPFVRTVEKVGRNDPCSCGSGRKFKKCCGANA